MMESLHGTSVLVVDDDLETLSLYVQSLERLGATASGVPDADTALSVLEVWRPDVVLCDLHLPVTDGYGLLARLRQRAELADLPVIAISGSHPDIEREECRRATFCDHLVKPVRLTNLVSAIASAMRTK